MPINEKVMLKHIDKVARVIAQADAEYVAECPPHRRIWEPKFVYVDHCGYPFGVTLSGIRPPANLCTDEDGEPAPYGVWDACDDKKRGRKRYIETWSNAIRGGLTFEYIKTLILADHWQIHPNCRPYDRLGLGEILDIRGWCHEILSDGPEQRGEPIYTTHANSPITDEQIRDIKRIAPPDTEAYIEEHYPMDYHHDAYWCEDLEAAKLLKKIDPNLQILNLKTQKML